MSFFEKLRTRKLLSFTLVLFTLSVGIVIGTLITNSSVKAAKGAQVAPGATELKIPNPVELSTAFSQIAKTLEPSVVNISTKYFAKTTSRGRTPQRRQASPFGEDQGDSDNGGGMEEFFRFFGNPFGQGMPDMPNRASEALGSGVVVDKAGYILTNNHVVDKADQIKVKFAGDPTEYDAKVVGVDEPTDLAVIRVEGKTNLTPAKIGNSDAVQVGDWAVAIGSPFGFQATVTAGIISARERDIPGERSHQYQHFLQTDAAINPGNSGGPLLNARGEVIGINTAIASQSGGYQGIGFALPINTAAEVYNQIIKNGKVTRGSIGINFTQSDSDRARANLKVAGVSEGVFVEQVAPGGPAEKAGLQMGDVIVALNGKPVREGNDLVSPITATPVGTTVTLGVMRDGKRQDFRVTTADIAQIFPEDFGGAAQQGAARPEGTTSKFGVDIQNMTDQWRQANGVKQAGGVRIVSVKPDSFADDIGLKPGDILLAINRTPVNSVEEVNRAQANLKTGDAVQLRVLRRNGRNGDWNSMFVAGMLPNNPQ